MMQIVMQFGTRSDAMPEVARRLLAAAAPITVLLAQELAANAAKQKAEGARCAMTDVARPRSRRVAEGLCLSSAQARERET